MNPTKSFFPETRMLSISLAVASAFAACSTSAFAGEHHAIEKNSIRKSSSAESMIFGQHHQHHKLSPAERLPKQAPSSVTAKFDYSKNQARTLMRPSAIAKAASATADKKAMAAACNVSEFAAASGSALVSLIKSSDINCINDLFSVSGSQANAIFKESQMVTVANAFRNAASSYNGTNSSNIAQMVLFLRAGYYVQFYDKAVGNYGPNLVSAIQGALDTFVNNANFGTINDAHGEILSEVVTLVDSSNQNARYLNSVVKRMLTLNNSFMNSWWMRSAVNNAFTVLFRGHQNEDFKQLVQSDTSIIDTLYNFMNTNWSVLGTDNDFLVSNAARELGRFLQYTDGSAIKNLAKGRVKAMVDRSNVSDKTASVWVGLGEMIEFYDKKNCSYYNMCDYQTKLDTVVLPIKHSCSPTLRLRAQALTQAQLEEACRIVGGEEGYFHQQVQSGNVPVAKDNNKQLEMVIFKSSKDYGTYAGSLFGIDTNNGGMYLEGDPSDVNNQARFIAYQAEWMLPKFEIWNLTHEYIHYLDGRFNMFGDFNDAISVPKTIWWIEGFAEYMSYSYRKLDYADAKKEAGLKSFRLSEIFANDYNSGQTRVYNWGYLATRYMFEKQRGRVSSILGQLRSGDYKGFNSYMNSIGTSLDSDFSNWLPCVNNPSLPQCPVVDNSNLPPKAAFDAKVNGLSVQFTDKSTDADGTVKSRQWNFGDNTPVSTETSPLKSYTKDGTYKVVLTVTDDKNATSSISQDVTVKSTTANKPPVADFSFAADGLKVTFTDKSSDPDGSIKSRSWSFGDGSNSTDVNPVKTFAKEGTYTVTVKVTDNADATTSISKTVTVTQAANKAPVADFGGAVSGLTVKFTDKSSDADGKVVSRKWDFGDNTSSAEINPSKTYSAAGTYKVTLTVTDDKGASTTSAAQSFKVSKDNGGNQAPVAGFSSSANGLIAIFTDTSSDADGKIVSRVWDFGDNTSSTAVNPAKKYAKAGVYTVKLTVTDDGGATSVITKSVTVTDQGGTTDLPECAGAAEQLGKNCARSNLSAKKGEFVYMYLYVPAGTPKLVITKSGGKGTADLLISTNGTWPTSDNLPQKNLAASSSVTINNPPEGYVFVSLYGSSKFSGVKVSTQY